MVSDSLRNLLLDWRAINGDGGPGTTKNGRGSWHLFCHLAAASALYRFRNRHAGWVGVVFDKKSRMYRAAMVTTLQARLVILPLKSNDARNLIAGGEWFGYLEGASRGHILDRDADDPGDPKIDDRRQDYNQRINSQRDGGPVWELWTVSRDIRARNRLGNSLVEAYGELLTVLGARFAAVVARGRMEPEYGHLRQMCAMIDAGLISAEAALTDIDAVAIPPNIERVLLDATPRSFAHAASLLANVHRKPCYFMYSRKLSSFASASLLRRIALTLNPVVRDRR